MIQVFVLLVGRNGGMPLFEGKYGMGDAQRRRMRCRAAGQMRCGGAGAGWGGYVGEMWCVSRSPGNGSRTVDYELEVKCQYSGRKV